MPDSPHQTLAYRWRESLRTVRRHPVYRSVNHVVKSAKSVLPDAWRRATADWRQLPGAVIVGAQKAGTTQLYASLVRHPRCFGGVAKEIQYFSKHADRPASWYRSRFPLARRVHAANGICLEASPSYLTSPTALRKMRELMPELAVIVILRDPVSRAFSHYQHYKTRHLESRSFHAAVTDAIEHHGPTPDRTWSTRSEARPLMDYVARGYYALQIEALWQCYRRERVLILDSGDLFADTNRACQRVFDFLGLERFDVPATKIYNRGYYRETIDPGTAALLAEHYRPHDELLAELVGRPFAWMTPARRQAAA